MAVLLDVWSDIACPWCYVGKARLDQAIQNLRVEGGEDVKVTVKWHPYMIDRNTNPSGEEYLAYNQRRWGSAAWTSSLRRSAAKDGLAFMNWKWWPNTLNAHRLVLLAETKGKAADAVQLLFKLTYEEGQNVSDLEVLCSAAENLKLPNAQDYLTSGQGEEEVLEEDRAAKEKFGIHSVPYFLVNKRCSLSGAQEPSTIEQAIRNEWTLANKA